MNDRPRNRTAGVSSGGRRSIAMMKKDRIYGELQETVQPFEFNEKVVGVFDDMINRSVPLYGELIRRQAQLAARYHRPEGRIYDLGCSNGNLGLLLMAELGEREYAMTAVDSSAPMLEAYGRRLAERPGASRVSLLQEDIRSVPINDASVVIVNLTLQFLPVADREDLIRRVYDGLLPGGILLFTEKVVHENPEMSALQQEYYYRFKKENGYSELEISQKRDALENVLVPETVETHVRRLSEAGFDKIDNWLKWFNFAAFLCRK